MYLHNVLSVFSVLCSQFRTRVVSLCPVTPELGLESLSPNCILTSDHMYRTRLVTARGGGHRRLSNCRCGHNITLHATDILLIVSIMTIRSIHDTILM